MDPSPTIFASITKPLRRRLLATVCTGAIVVLALSLLIASLALAGPGSFPDVPSDHPYAAAIADLSSRGIISGYTNGDFGLNDPVKRAQFAKMIVGSLGIPPNAGTGTRFSDLGTPDAKGYPHIYVQAAFDHGITYGTNAAQTLFAPWNSIHRDQVVSMIVRGANNVAPGTLEEPPAGYVGSFPGVGDPHGPNLRIAEYNGLLDGLIRFGPDWVVSVPATRGEVAQMLHNLIVLLDGGTTTTSTDTTSTTEAPTTTSSTTTTSTTELPQSGDLIYFCWTNTYAGAENVSAYTGAKIASSPVGWSEGFDELLGAKICIAAVSPNDDLLLFTRPSPGSWQVENLSQKTGQKVGEAPAVWRFWETLEVLHLAAPSPSGDLLHFWREQGAGFAVDNVTQRTGGPKVAGSLASLLTGWGDTAVEHVIARSATGDLIVFFDHPLQHDWSWFNVSQATGRTIAGSLAAWLRYADSGPELHVAAVGTDGALLHFTGAAETPWQVEDLTAQLGRSVQDGIVGWSTWNMTVAGSHNIAGVSPGGDLLRFWKTGQTWLYENVSAQAGGKVVAPLSHLYEYVSYPGLDSWRDYLVANNLSGDVVAYHDELLQHSWQAWNITQQTGERATGPFGAWMDYPPDYTVANLAGLQPD